MKKLLERFARRGAQTPPQGAAAPQETPGVGSGSPAHPGTAEQPARSPSSQGAAAPQETPEGGSESPAQPGAAGDPQEIAPKLPPELPLFFMLSHLVLVTGLK